MAEVTSWEIEITSSIPASKVFHEFVIVLFDFLVDNFFPKDFGMTITNLEGDGGVGTVKIMMQDGSPQAKYKITELDLENFVYGLVAFQGTGEDELESTLSEIKVIPSIDGGCTLIWKNKEFKEMSEGDIEFEKEQIAQWFKAFEGTVSQDFNDH